MLLCRKTPTAKLAKLPSTKMTKLSIDRTGQLWIGKGLSIHLLLIPLCLAAYFGRYLSLFAVSWGIAFLHESAHILTANALKVSVSGISLLPFGVCARLSEPVIKSPAKEILIALAGPIASFFIAGLCYLVYLSVPAFLLWYAAAAGFAMGLLNLLPCLPLDGGRILRALLTIGSDVLSAWQTSMRISRIIAAALIAAAVYLLLTSAFQFSLLLISVFLLGNLCSEQKSISRQALRELLYYKEKLEQDQFNRTCLLSAYQSLPARRLLHRLSYHKYYTIQVLDTRNHVLGYLTESQILDALLHRSIRLTLGEIMDSAGKSGAPPQ